MTYSETLQFLYNSLPMYQREGKAAYKANLDNTHRLDEAMGKPHASFPSIHVAGTNGKGSVSHMLASVLEISGLKTGLYTSPHLLDFRERIRINGIPIPKKEVTGFVSRHQGLIEEIHPSFFEMTVAMAFDYFASQQVDVAVIETGLGGRLDSTNIITPALSIITNISLDHTEFLGTDLPSIAREKGGIIKAGVPIVLGRTGESYEEILTDLARIRKAPLVKSQDLYAPAFYTQTRDEKVIFRLQNKRSGELEPFTCDLAGIYQQENLITALCSIQELQKLGWELTPSHIEEGLATVTTRTGIKGRWQTIGHNPRSICDTAHNDDGITAVMEQIRQVARKELHVVWGMVDDKDLNTILPLLPKEAHYYFTQSAVPRSLNHRKLLHAATAFDLKGSSFPSVEEAYQAALDAASPQDMIFTGGSTFVVADLLTFTQFPGS